MLPILITVGVLSSKHTDSDSGKTHNATKPLPEMEGGGVEDT